MTEPREDDIKRLLDRAIGHEPPLSLNRTEILRDGRRKVRNRRLAASGGVAASVVAVVIGAASLTNLVGGTSDEDITPAMSSSATSGPVSATTTAPETTPGLSLPLTPTSAPLTTGQLPRATQPEKHTALLTAELAAANPIPNGIRAYPARDQSKPPLTFSFEKDAYLAAAELVDSRGTGGFEIEIAYIREPNARIACESSTEQVTVSCLISDGVGYQMSKTTRTAKAGPIEYIVRVFRKDGTDILVAASNVSGRGPGDRPTAPNPLVGYPVLEKIATNPRLTYG